MSNRSTNQSNPHKQKLYLVWTVVILCLIEAVLVAALFLRKPQGEGNISNFQQCKDAGSRIAESYPEQCMLGGQTFVNDAQSVDAGNEYVGMSEQEALDKAKAEDKTARVVERDGESLPMTMDLQYGRLNFYIQDGMVYRVYVESESS